MNSVTKIKILFSTLSLALAAAAPFARAQNAAPSAASAAAPSAASPADAPPPPRGKGGMRGADPLAKVTGLTDDQKTQIKTIRDASRAKVEALPDDDSKRAAMRGIMMDTNKQVRAVLTPDQQKQFDAAMKQMMNRRKKGGDDAPPPPPPSGN